MKLKPMQSKLAKEIMVLVAVLLVVAGLTIFKFGAPQPAPETKPQPLNTQFDTDTADKIKDERDDLYPVVEPAPGELGKPDPFAR